MPNGHRCLDLLFTYFCDDAVSLASALLFSVDQSLKVKSRCLLEILKVSNLNIPYS